MKFRQARAGLAALVRFANLGLLLVLSACGAGGGSSAGGGGGVNTPSVTADTGGASTPGSSASSGTAAGCDLLPPYPSKPSRTRSVLEFGAVPDDGLDDTAAIQQALDALLIRLHST